MYDRAIRLRRTYTPLYRALTLTLSLCLLWILALAEPVGAQSEGGESTGTANTVFAEAVRLNEAAKTMSPEERLETTQEIVRLLDLIATAFPESIPGQRILAGGAVGPIDLPALRELVAASEPQASREESAQKDAGEIQDSTQTEAPQPEVIEDTFEWYQRVIATGAMKNGHAHGEFPVAGPRTHPGADIIATCGATVTAPLDGEVIKVIKAGDEAYARVGNALVIRHGDDAKKHLFSVYFHLGRSPAVSIGPVEKGQVIGEAGQIDHADSCGVHFEVRRFHSDTQLKHPLWNDVLPVGDWREDKAFKGGWLNPVSWGEQLLRIEALENGQFWKNPFVRLKNGALFPATHLTRFSIDRTTYRGTSVGGDLSLSAEFTVFSNRDGVDVEIENITGLRPSGDNKNKANVGSNLSVSLKLMDVLECEGCVPISEYSENTKVKSSIGNVTSFKTPIFFQIPYEEAMQSEGFILSLTTNAGAEFQLQPNFRFGDPEEVSKAFDLSHEEAEMFLRRFLQCAAFSGGPGESITIAARFRRNGEPRAKWATLIGYEFPEGNNAEKKERALEQLAEVQQRLKLCGSKDFGLPEEKFKSWSMMEIMLGDFK